MNIREALPTFLASRGEITGVVSTRIFPVIRQQGSDAPALVFRVTNGDDGKCIGGDTGERVYQVELVIWHRDYLAAAQLGEALKSLFHGTGRYYLGDISIDESWKVNEYDGDRVTDSYSDAGDFAITYVFDFHWSE